MTELIREKVFKIPPYKTMWAQKIDVTRCMNENEGVYMRTKISTIPLRVYCVVLSYE